MSLHRLAATASLALVVSFFSGCEKKQAVPTPEEAAKRRFLRHRRITSRSKRRHRRSEGRSE